MLTLHLYEMSICAFLIQTFYKICLFLGESFHKVFTILTLTSCTKNDSAHKMKETLGLKEGNFFFKLFAFIFLLSRL